MAEGTPVPKAIIKLAPLWKFKNKNGVYLGGSVGDVRYYVFPNQHKHPEGHADYEKTKAQPDYQICIGERPPKAEASEQKGDEL